MAKQVFEQEPVKQKSAGPGFVEVNIQRSGDDIVDAGTKALYENLGYTFKEESKLGTVTMVCPMDVHLERQKKAIADHRARENAQYLTREDRAGLIGVKEDISKANTPVSAESLASQSVDLSPNEPDFDEL